MAVRERLGDIRLEYLAGERTPIVMWVLGSFVR
jgi:hypothetical protein